MFVIHGSLQPRVRHFVVRQAREGFGESGTLRATVQPRGALGLLANDVWAIDLYGENNRSQGIPFKLYPKGGWKGSIRHLRIHLKNFEMNGMRVAGLEGDIPFAKYDLSHAMVRGRLHLRGAEPGTATVLLSAENVRDAMQRRFGDLISDAAVTLEKDRVLISGKLLLLGLRQAFRSTNSLVVREGRLELAESTFFLNEKPVPALTLSSMLKQINPVFDVDRDLKVRNFFTITGVKVVTDLIRVEGILRVPVEEPVPKKVEPPKPKPDPFEVKENSEKEGEPDW
jgi:hypothetical protein